MSGARERKTAVRQVRAEDSRARIERALERCSDRERQLLALLLYERLSPPEVADALGISVARLRRVYEGLLRDLHGALEGDTPRARRARLADEATGMRRAS